MRRLLESRRVMPEHPLAKAPEKHVFQRQDSDAATARQLRPLCLVAGRKHFVRRLEGDLRTRQYPFATVSLKSQSSEAIVESWSPEQLVAVFEVGLPRLGRLLIGG